MLVDGKPSWGTPNLPTIIVQGRVGGKWMEEGEGGEHEEAGGSGWRRAKVTEVPATTTAITTITTALTTTAGSIGF